VGEEGCKANEAGGVVGGVGGSAPVVCTVLVPCRSAKAVAWWWQLFLCLVGS